MNILEVARKNELYLNDAAKYAFKCHRETNHKYDGMPYSRHLINAFEYGWKYKYLLDHSINLILAAILCHDVIEDTRQTYNDVGHKVGGHVAEIVYALTNEKGKNRKERANKKYYDGIKEAYSGYGVFVKLCDRLANVNYSIKKEKRLKNLLWRFYYKWNGRKLNSMLEVYKKENKDFFDALYEPRFSKFKIMFDEINYLLNIPAY